MAVPAVVGEDGSGAGEVSAVEGGIDGGTGMAATLGLGAFCSDDCSKRKRRKNVVGTGREWSALPCCCCFKSGRILPELADGLPVLAAGLIGDQVGGEEETVAVTGVAEREGGGEEGGLAKEAVTTVTPLLLLLLLLFVAAGVIAVSLPSSSSL